MLVLALMMMMMLLLFLCLLQLMLLCQSVPHTIHEHIGFVPWQNNDVIVHVHRGIDVQRALLAARRVHAKRYVPFIMRHVGRMIKHLDTKRADVWYDQPQKGVGQGRVMCVVTHGLS